MSESNDTMFVPNNILVPFGRRFPEKLSKKHRVIDSEIARKIAYAWDMKKERGMVLEYYLQNCHRLSDERYWELLRTVWVLCGTKENTETFRKLFKSERDKKHFFSSVEDSQTLAKLQPQVTIYRATDDMDDTGISWTVSKNYAEDYKKTFNKKFIVEKTINKNLIFAFINRNLEYEVIVLDL